MKQPSAAKTNSEAEYQAMAAATHEVLHLRSLINEMGVTTEKPTVIEKDNQNCFTAPTSPRVLS